MTHIWKLVEVWFWKEWTRQTASSIAKWMPKTSIDFDDVSDQVVDESSIWIINDSIEEYLTQRMAEWNIEANARNESIAYPLLSLLSDVTSSQIGSSAVYSHVFTEGQNNENQSLTIWVKDPVQSKEFTWAVINSMTISWESWGFITISMDFMSLKWNDQTYTTAYDADYNFLTKHVTFKTWSSIWSLTSRNIRSFEINFQKNVEPEPVVWSIEPADFFNTELSISWSFTAKYENEADYKDKNLDWTYQALDITAEDTTNDIWSWNHPLLQIELPKAYFEEWAAQRDSSSIVTQEVSFKWLYDTWQWFWSRITLQNNTTSY